MIEETDLGTTPAAEKTEPVSIATPAFPAQIAAASASSPAVWTITIARPTLGQLLNWVLMAGLLIALLGHVVPSPGRVTTAPLHATLVVDTDATDPHRTGADITAGGGPETALTALNCKWREYDKDSATLASRNLKSWVAKAGGPPALIVQADGIAEPVLAVAAPSSADGVVALVKKLRGVK